MKRLIIRCKIKKENLALQTNTYICNRILKNEKKFPTSENKNECTVDKFYIVKLNPCSLDI